MRTILLFLLALINLFPFGVTPALSQTVTTLDADSSYQLRIDGNYGCLAKTDDTRVIGSVLRNTTTNVLNFAELDGAAIKKQLASNKSKIKKLRARIKKTNKKSAIKKYNKQIAALKADNSSLTRLQVACPQWPGPFALPPPIQPTLPPEPEANSNSLLFLDQLGYTPVVNGSNFTVRVFVSSSRGDDQNDGLSRSRPVRSLSRGYDLIRANSADQLLLRRGDTWNETFPTWTKSGHSDRDILVIGSYIDVNALPTDPAPRPLLLDGSLRLEGQVSNVAITDLEFRRESTLSADSAVAIIGGTGNFPLSRRILVENCKIQNYYFGVNVEGDPIQPTKEIYLRRNIITDSNIPASYLINSSTPLPAPAGVRMRNHDYVVLQANVFDHNGWIDQQTSAGARYNRRQVDLPAGIGRVQAVSNYFLRGADLGLAIETTGEVSLVSNLFAAEPRAAEIKARYALLAQNVVSDGPDLGSGLQFNRGWGFDITSPSLDVFLNIFVNAASTAYIAKNQTGDHAIRYHGPMDGGLARINNNVIYKFPGGIQADSFIVTAPAFREFIEYNVISNDDLVAPLIWVKGQPGRWLPSDPSGVALKQNQLDNPYLPLGKLWAASETGSLSPDYVTPGCVNSSVNPPAHGPNDSFYSGWYFYQTDPLLGVVSSGDVGLSGDNSTGRFRFCPDSGQVRSGPYEMTAMLDSAAWQTISGDLTSIVGPISFPDPTRTVGSFNSYLGTGAASTADFATVLRDVDKNTRKTQLRDARFVYEYLAGGFMRGPQS